LTALPCGLVEQPPLQKVKEEVMPEANKYNGWSNRETWVVNLWLTNDQSAYDALQHDMKAFESLGEQAEELEHWVRCEYGIDDLDASVVSDLISTSLGRIDWFEIVQNNQG
jgi:hypothetical protein